MNEKIFDSLATSPRASPAPRPVPTPPEASAQAATRADQTSVTADCETETASLIRSSWRYKQSVLLPGSRIRKRKKADHQVSHVVLKICGDKGKSRLAARRTSLACELNANQRALELQLRAIEINLIAAAGQAFFGAVAGFAGAFDINLFGLFRDIGED